MVAGVCVENIHGFDFVEKVFLRVGAINVGDARVESGAEQGGEPGFFKAFAISPLPRVFEFCVIRRFVVCGVHVVHAGVEASVHQRQILIRERDVDEHLRFEFAEQRDDFLHVVGIDLRGFEHDAGRVFDVGGDCLAFVFVARGEHDFAEFRRVLRDLVSDDVADAARTDDERSFFHLWG